MSYQKVVNETFSVTTEFVGIALIDIDNVIFPVDRNKIILKRKQITFSKKHIKIVIQNETYRTYSKNTGTQNINIHPPAYYVRQTML